MPILAVAAVAVGAIATTTIAASTVAMVGLATSVVGKVTKSKELMKLGAGLSLGAGVASVASSVFGGSATLGAAEGAGGAGTGAGGAVEAAPGISESAGSLEGTAGSIESAANVGGGSTAEGLTSGLGESAEAGSGGLLSPSTAGQSVGAPAMPGSEAGATAQGALNTAINSGAGALAPPTGTDSFSISKWWSGMSDATKNRLLQMGGQAAGGLFEGWTQEQKLAFEREKANLARDQYNTSMKNASAQPKVAFKPVSPITGGLLTPQRG